MEQRIVPSKKVRMLLIVLSVVLTHALEATAKGKVAVSIAKKALKSQGAKMIQVKKIVRYKQPLTDLDTATDQITQEVDLLTDGEWRSPALTESDALQGTDLLEQQPSARIEIR